MREKRRLLLKGLLGITTMATAMTAMPRLAMAKWSKAFDSSSVDDALNDLYGTTALTTDDTITLKIPEIAENGAVVPITVSSTLENIATIAILVDNNPTPLTSSFTLSVGAPAYVSTRVKMAKTSTVTAILSTRDGQYFSASKTIKVTIGGCGG